MKSPMNSQSESDSVGTLSPQISCRFGVQFSLHIIVLFFYAEVGENSAFSPQIIAFYSLYYSAEHI